jgi:hypothetical protein
MRRGAPERQGNPGADRKPAPLLDFATSDAVLMSASVDDPVP